MRNTTIGVELEGFIVDSAGRPVDTLELLGAPFVGTGSGKFEGITSDMGRSSVELITKVCTTGVEVGESLDRVLQLVPRRTTTIFKPRPLTGPVTLVEKPRATVMHRALSAEHEQGHLGIATVAPWCATHFHIGVGSVETDEATLLLNVLNNIAPYARRAVNNRYDVEGAKGHLNIWQGWCNPVRVPDSRWFLGIEDLRGFIGTIPKLVIYTDGEWKRGDGTPSKLGDPDSEGTLWWLARPRGKLQTIEWRPFPALDPRHVPGLTDAVLKLVEAFWNYIATHKEVSRVRIESTELGELYRFLSSVSWLVPTAPLTDFEWWRLYRA